jgi:hypothetical protein
VGADALRSGALSDPEVVALLNGAFVPVWVNARTTALPPLPPEVLEQVLVQAGIDGQRHVVDIASRAFFLRSIVLTPDARTLLNPQAPTAGGSVASWIGRGHFSYQQQRTAEYLEMLRGALARVRFATAR